MNEDQLLDKFKILGKNVQKIEMGTARRINVFHIFGIAKKLGILPHELCEGL